MSASYARVARIRDGGGARVQLDGPSEMRGTWRLSVLPQCSDLTRESTATRYVHKCLDVALTVGDMC